MKTKAQLIAQFYVLARDNAPPGLRYCELAPVWLDMAVMVVCGRAAARVDRLKDVHGVRVLQHMLALQREHDGLVSASTVADSLEELRMKLDAISAQRLRWHPWVPRWLRGALTTARP